MSTTQYQGLIPPPDWMQAYNDAIPNGADRILAMAEKQEGHRQHLERTKVESDVSAEKRGLVYGLVVAIAGLLVGGGLVYTGHDTAGAIICGTRSYQWSASLLLAAPLKAENGRPSVI
jgi:uncharacterized membrane protein